MQALRSFYSICLVFPSLFFQIIHPQAIAAISYGELIDKITILTIKTERIRDQEKLKNIYRELEALQQTYIQCISNPDLIIEFQHALKTVNEELWDIEDAIRVKERHQEFDEEFIQLARKVYLTNDRRCMIKKQIDKILGSHLTEEKSYENIT